MIIKTTTGRKVNLVSTDRVRLYDSDKNAWHRDGESDIPGHAAYKCGDELVFLNLKQLVRVCNGDHDIVKLIDIEELRVYVGSLSERERACLERTPMYENKALSHSDPIHCIAAMIEKAEDEELERIKAEEALRKPTEDTSVAREPKGGYRSTPKRKAREEGFRGTFEGNVVSLTIKQVEFMERLSENPGWGERKENGEYFASLYTDELSDTMSPMCVGAVMTTLKEKGIIDSKRVQKDGYKTSLFWLTNVGKMVYRCMANGRG